MIESKIFKSEEVLLPEFLPEFLPHREEQIKHLAENLLPAAEKRIPQNTFIFGPPGTGKTASVKFVFKEFENYANVKTVYINCWDYKTIVAIFSKISLELEAFVKRKGMSKDEVLERFVEACNKLGKSLIICLDEVDQLVFHDKTALYDLLRLNQYLKVPVGLVFVSNDPFVFLNIDPRIKSSLNVEEMEFKPYSFLEMKDILEERAKLAFFSFESAVVLLAANHAVQNGGDVRIGLECLLKAGKEAERNKAKKVEASHVKAVLASIRPIKPEILKERLNLDEKIILQIIEEKKKVFTDKLYEIYCKRIEYPVSERRFRDFLNHLAEIGLVKIVGRKRGVVGRKRIVMRI